MSLRQFTPRVDEVLRGDILDYGRVVDVFLDDRTLRFWDRFHALELDDGVEGPVTYEPVGDRLTPPDEVSEDQSTDGSTIEISFDSSRISDPNDFLGGIITLPILQRRVRIRSVLFEPGTNHTEPLWLFNEQNGLIDKTPDEIQVGSQSRLTFSIRSGTFAYLERRNLKYSNTDQQRLYPGDTGLSHIGNLVDIRLPWGQ